MITEQARPESLRRFPGTPPVGLVPAIVIGAYVAIALGPLVLAQLQGTPPRGFWREFSSGLAMVGFAMLLVEFVLSGRFRQVSGKVGIDLTMRFHQLAALSILVFLVVHPFLYAVPRLAESPGAAMVQVQRMFASGGLRTGVVAWGLLIVFVAAAVWRDRLPARYEIWRASHGLGAALIAGFGVHHTLAVGTHSANPALAGLWIVLTAFALAALAYIYAVKPLVRRAAPYRVVGNDRVAERMWRVAVESQTGPAMDFEPGQFVWLTLGHAPHSLTEHPFSMSSAPDTRPRIEFTVKESGDFTSRIGEIAPGTTAYLDGPHGSFTYAGRIARPLALIAGGVGFAPMMSLLRGLRAAKWTMPVTLVYGNRAESQILYRDELEVMARELDLTVHLVLSEAPARWTGHTGELTRDVLEACLSSDMRRDTLHFVCGPTPMMNAVEAGLADLGVPAANVVCERFRYD